MKMHEQMEEAFLRNYLPLITDEEAKARPYVVIGEKDGTVYLARPKMVMHKDGFCDPYVERPGISWFAYDMETKKRTWGQQAAFLSFEDLGYEPFATFDTEGLYRLKGKKFDTEFNADALIKRGEFSRNMYEHKAFA